MKMWQVEQQLLKYVEFPIPRNLEYILLSGKHFADVVTNLEIGRSSCNFQVEQGSL